MLRTYGMALRSVSRTLCTTRTAQSKTVSSRIIVPPASHFNNQGPQFNRIPRDKYKQLPDDSDYIEKFYDELQLFSQDFLEKQLHKKYTDFEECPEELVFQLDQFIELQIIPRYSKPVKETGDNHAAFPLRSIQCKTISDKIVIERYLDFAKGVKLTLMLNGVHTFIFDVLLQAKSVFDNMERSKNEGQSS
ncbi:related to protein FMP23, mitochondrial [Zygosaccharomyces bailii]|nr:related to protein FMP23, mitochondrial [Zygosaccharomyces bailii]